MTALLSFLVALLLSVLGHGPAPAPHRVTASPAASAPAAVAPPTVRKHPMGTPVPPAAAPTVAPAPAPDPANTQLPDEVIGRAITCPDGSDGRIVAADLSTDCRP